MKKYIISCYFLIICYANVFSQSPKHILSLADSSVHVFFGANLKTTMLLTNRRPAPSTGTAYLLLPKDATGVEGTFDLNARASTIYLAADGPQLGSFKLGTKMVFYVIRDLSDPAYGLLPALMYVDMKNDQWRFAAGQQVDVFAVLEQTGVRHIAAGGNDGEGGGHGSAEGAVF